MSTVRPFTAGDTRAADLIMASCTRELRQVYGPRPDAAAPAPEAAYSSRLVAVDEAGIVIGIAECIGRSTALYVQGIAVAPARRRRGVAGELLAYGALLAAATGSPALELATIKETGNVEIFCRLGFRVVGECLSQRYWSREKRPVTEVTLRRLLA